MIQKTPLIPVRKKIGAAVSPAHGFEVLPSGLGRWWPRDMGIGKLPMKTAGNPSRRPLVRTRRRWFADDRGQECRLGAAAAVCDHLGDQQPVAVRSYPQLGGGPTIC